jgi:hypothetical protein
MQLTEERAQRAEAEQKRLESILLEQRAQLAAHAVAASTTAEEMKRLLKAKEAVVSSLIVSVAASSVPEPVVAVG